MKRKIISLLLCLVMALSLIPTVAFAATEDLTTNGEYDSQGIWTANTDDGSVTTNDGLTLSKTAQSVGKNTYQIDLKVITTQTTTTVTTSSDAATVLVIDTSGSMAWCTQNHKHTPECYSTVECTPELNPSHYWWGEHLWLTSCRYDNGKYYTVNKTCGQTRHTHDNASGGVWCGGSGASRIASAKAAAKDFLDDYRDTTAARAARWVAVVSFADGAADDSAWFNVSTEDGYNNAIAAIDGLTASGGTNLDAGLRAANSLMANDAVSAIVKKNKNVIALTDGAPTQSANYGDGRYGSSEINAETENTAETLQGNVNALYTICFAASGETCYQEGPTVDTFLSGSIASSPDNAYTPNDASGLNLAFGTITNTITSGLTGEGGWTVTDPMADNISVVDGSTSSEFVLTDANSKTYTWTLINPKQTSNGNTTTYTYATRYTVTIAPNGTDLNENDFYPTNKVTTLHYTDAKGNPQTADFPVPGVKVKLPDPTPTTGSLNINKVLSGVTADRDMTFTFDVKNGNEIVNENVYVYIQSGEERGSTVVENLPVGTYTVVEKTPIPAPDGYTLSGTTYYYGDGATSANVPPNGRATVTVTNTYEEESTPPAEVSVEISVTKNVTISRGSKEPAETLFTFEASVGDQKFTLPLIPKKAENWTATGMLRVSIPYELFKDDVATVTIKEIPGGDTRWKYDTKEYTVFVYQDGTYEVKSENPEIAARSMNQEQKPTALTFTNEYSYKYTPTPKPTTPAKPVTSVKTGDMGVALYAGLAILSMTGSAGVILRRRKNDK